MALDVARGEGAPAASVEQAVGPYLRAIQRHWRLVVAATLLAGLVAAFTVSRAGQTYQANASILVSPLPQTNSSFQGIGTVVDTGDPARTVQTAAALIDTPEAAAAAARKLGRGWNTAKVTADVAVTPRGASDVLAITAQASNGADAARVANAFASSAIANRATIVQGQIATELAALDARMALLKNTPTAPEATALATTIAQLRSVQGAGREPTLSISQVAQPATSPTGAPHWLIVALALIAGFILGAVAAVGLETFTRPVRDRSELTTLFPIPVLATIPQVNRRQRDGRLPPWNFPPVAFEQMRTLRVQLSLGIVSPVIMVTSAGAGDGKTTVAAALAAAFAEVDEDVILMDLDLRKPDAESLLGVERVDELDVYESAISAEPIPVERMPRVRVVPAPRGDLAKFETVIRRLPDVLAEMRRMASCIIIDTPPVGEVSEALRIAPICDEVLFVARPRHTDRRRLILARELLERADAPMAGMVVVARDTGLPSGHYGYGYSTNLNGDVDEQDQRSMSSAGAKGSRDIKSR